MNEVILTKAEQEIMVFMISEFCKRDGHTIEDASPEVKSVYYKCGGKE